MKASELIGPVLNWAAGHALGHDYNIVDGVPVSGKTVYTSEGLGFDEVWEPSTSWAQGGPIIEREHIQTWKDDCSTDWLASNPKDSLMDRAGAQYAAGATPLIAAMRCLVASELGEEVEIPEEFV